ncbi:hypothetical protein [Flavobacterium microcysteis]|uniref:Uncharacterized protein n=1 Tax=Flavobacterium microcysteis TaxID=2596891 RepID=A0A501PZ69_9FLAO|nr:hypothetical protein [Flavobacterium microcysteis]TPD65334.1 hypothetical protein FJA49_14130 [Flavobacterium microcysteis]
MKNSILTLAMIALSMSANATEVKTAASKENATEITKDRIVVVYDWSVKTNQGNYSGTAQSLEKAESRIIMAAAGEIILDKKIESFYQLAEEVSNPTLRLYFWEVETVNGTAKGFSSSENHALRMIQLISTNDILTYKIIRSAEFDR